MEKKVKRYVMQVVCALSAIALWLFVTYTEDPEASLWFRDIPVTYIGAESLDAKNLAFIKEETPETINVKVTGRRSALQRLPETDIKVTVDYNAVTGTGYCTLPVSATISRNDVRIARLSHSSLTYEVDVLETVEKHISITHKGAEDLHLSQFTASPATVQVTGPKSLLPNIVPNVHIDLSHKESAETYKITLQDQDGKNISDDNITLLRDSVEIHATRDLEVAINVEPVKIPQGKQIVQVVCDPARVPVRGSIQSLLASDAATASVGVWITTDGDSASTGPLSLTFPENVEVVDKDTASATYYFQATE